ncbi:MAG: hypothetical protein AAGA54_33960 [Myxococcota bacterium]
MTIARSARLLPLALLGALSLASGCDGDDAKSSAKSESKPAEDAKPKPALRLQNDTDACRQALECCVERVKLDNDGKAEPDQINLSCSGIGMAQDDATCKQFAQGYAYNFEKAGKPLPEVCKEP